MINVTVCVHAWDGSGKIRSPTSSRCLAAGPSATGASAAVVHWLFGFKFGRQTQGGQCPYPQALKWDVAAGIAVGFLISLLVLDYSPPNKIQWNFQKAFGVE